MSSTITSAKRARDGSSDQSDDASHSDKRAMVSSSTELPIHTYAYHHRDNDNDNDGRLSTTDPTTSAAVSPSLSSTTSISSISPSINSISSGSSDISPLRPTLNVTTSIQVQLTPQVSLAEFRMPSDDVKIADKFTSEITGANFYNQAFKMRAKALVAAANGDERAALFRNFDHILSEALTEDMEKLPMASSSSSWPVALSEEDEALKREILASLPTASDEEIGNYFGEPQDPPMF